MANKAITNTIAYATDTYRDAIEKLTAEITAAYGYINTLYRLQYGTATPTDNTTGDVWIDTNGTAPTLKYYNGSTWAQLGASGNYISGVTLDDGTKDYSRNAIPKIVGTTQLQLEASATEPVTLAIQGIMLQVTSTPSYATVSGAAGTRDIYVKRASSSATTFTLHTAASPYTVSTGSTPERIIGQCYWDGSKIAWVRAYENEGAELNTFVNDIFMVYLSDTPGVTLNGTTGAELQLTYDTDFYDPFNAHSGGTFTVPRTGYYEFHATMRVEPTSASNECRASVFIYRQGTALIGVDKQFGKEDIMCHASAQAYCVAGNAITVKGAQKTATPENIKVGVAGDGTRAYCAFWGRYLGKGVA